MEKESLRKAVLAMGADVCGFAAVARFDGAPDGFHPRDIHPACNSAIVYGVALPKGLLAARPEYIYSYFNHLSVPRVDDIGFRLARLLEDTAGGIAIPLPCDGPVKSYDAETKTKRGILSMKHAAVLAGIGTLGKNTLLLNERFGNRLTVGLVLTNVVFESDAPAKPICIERCRRCLDECPAHAIANGSVTQKPCREHTYTTDALGYTKVMCNRCRTICPMRFGE